MPPLKIGLAGTGTISRAHKGAFQEFPDDVQLTAICDIREDAARAYADEMGVEAVYTDFEQMLREADIDAVDICTVHATHRDLAVAAARANKHILLEKPMATSLEECRDIIGAAEDAGVTFMVAQMLRFLPEYQEAKRIIESGEVGTIWSARSDSWYPAALTGSFHGDNWWGFDRQLNGGGTLIMVAVHQIDLLRYWVGDVQRVTAKTWSEHPLMVNGAEDRVMATLEYANGAIGHCTSSYMSRTPWNWQVMALGDQGTIYTVPHQGNEHMAPPKVASAARDGDQAFNWETSFEWVEASGEGLVSDNAFTNEIVHFARSVRDGSEPLSSGRQNYNTMEVVHGIYESAATGKPVELRGLDG